MTGLVDCLLSGDVDSGAYYTSLEETTPERWPDLLALTNHPDPVVRRDVVTTLPLLSSDPAHPAFVDAAIRLTTDPDRRVRDHACFVLAEQWRELDTTEVREALAARLDDIDREARCEALVGLAYRRDRRALPRVRSALSRPGGAVSRLELVAAAALGDVDLHPLVLRHIHGWDELDEPTAQAARRLTDPEGVGHDLFRAVAGLYSDRAHDRPERAENLRGWQLMSLLLELAPERTQSFYTATAARLSDDPAGLELLRTGSGLAQLAGLIDDSP